jgi:hypothetical protein
MLLSGCSKWERAFTKREMSGDLAAFILKCAALRGSDVPTNGITPMSVRWTYHSNAVEDVFIVQGNHGAHIQSLLESTFGRRDPMTSFYPWKGVSVCSVGDTNRTVVCIIGSLRR